MITKLCSKVGVTMESGEERIRPEMPILAKPFEEIPMIGGGNPSLEILEEMKRIREIQEKLLEFADLHMWNVGKRQ